VGKLDGKVAFITGAGRGQGRSHAVRLAEEGADIIAVDICAPMPTVPYALATPDDLRETASMVEDRDRRIVACQADVRSRAQLASAVSDGLAALGHIDVVVANAGIMAVPAEGIDEERQWDDALAVMLTGVWHTIKVTVPSMIERGRGGCIVATGSTGGLRGISDGSGGIDGYGAAKHGVNGLVAIYANLLARHSIRVNSVHPTGVATPMVMNPTVEAWIGGSGYPPNALPVAAMDPADVSNAIVWLASDDARYVTGVALPVDAGNTINTRTVSDD